MGRGVARFVLFWAGSGRRFRFRRVVGLFWFRKGSLVFFGVEFGFRLFGCGVFFRWGLLFSWYGIVK